MARGCHRLPREPDKADCQSGSRPPAPRRPSPRRRRRHTPRAGWDVRGYPQPATGWESPPEVATRAQPPAPVSRQRPVAGEAASNRRDRRRFGQPGAGLRSPASDGRPPPARAQYSYCVSNCSRITGQLAVRGGDWEALGAGRPQPDPFQVVPRRCAPPPPARSSAVPRGNGWWRSRRWPGGT